MRSGCGIILLGYIYIVAESALASNNIYTRHRRYDEGKTCILPPYPEHGNWKLLNGVAKPNDKITENSVIKFECKNGYKLSVKNPHWVCSESWGSWELPECEVRCPPLYSSTTYTLNCTDKRGNEIKCHEATHKTFVEYECAEFYETPFGYRKSLLCLDGKWNQRPVCEPICGKKIVDDTKTLIFGSKPNEKLEYPWITPLYKRKKGSFKYICGGSILSTTVVLTAAHCVSNDYGNAFPKEDFRVGAGKLYSKYEASEDLNAQYLELSDIIVHEDYKADFRHFLADIALLVVKGEIVMSEVVKPVCLTNIKSIILHPGMIGEISGWGQSEDEAPSEKLRTLKIPYKYEPLCVSELPRNWADKFNLIDKMCVGFYNQSKSVCDGDSGNGFVFENPEDNRYYVHGIVSLGLYDLAGHCDIQQNDLYTKTALYYDFIIRFLTKYAPPIRDCRLPPHPRNGKWIIGEKDKKTGDYVPVNTILKLECDEGYLLSSSTANITCGSSHLMPICQKLCPILKFPNNTDYRCFNKAGLTIDCLDAVSGIRLWYSCPKRYQIPNNTTNLRVCVKGSWGIPRPECVKPPKYCGIKINSTRKTEDGEMVEKGLDQPWHIHLYRMGIENGTKQELSFVCGGAILSRKVIITNAGCVLDLHSNILPNSSFLIAAGKVYSKHDDPRDTQAQYTEVSNIIVHPKYKGTITRYLNDIAIMIMKWPFNFTSYVQPICFVDVDTISLRSGDKGEVTKYVENDKQETIEIAVKNEKTCTRELPSDFVESFYVIDKFCAGHHNQVSSLGIWDTGQSLAVKNPVDGRYYIHGVASAVPFEYVGKQRVFDKNDLYTNVTFYYNFIDDILSRYK